MANVIRYDRGAAVAYAEQWALKRNPKYADFHGVGGDCTNFVSQCLYAGARVMNHERDIGWYYIDANNRSPAWSGVVFLHRFLLGNKGNGPFAEAAEAGDMEKGDVIFLHDGNKVYHSLLVTDPNEGDPLIATHSEDSWNRPLSSYDAIATRPVKILGVRVPKR